MIYKVDKFISKHKLLEAGDKVLVALSGGADSVALLLALTRLGYRCCAMHCNFHLRGEESNRDQLFTEELCRKLGVELHTVHFNTKAYATEKGISIEMAARELRYTAFEEQRKNSGAVAIAVAHHRDDTAETVILNLLRGTGIKGLRGIRPRNGLVIRPLLCVGREDITEYLHRRGQEYVTDSTNLTTDYTRNKIRLEIIPKMGEVNPAIKESLAATAQRISDAELIYSNAVACAIERVKRGNRIDIDALEREIAPATILHEILAPLGFNSAQVEDIYTTLDGDSGKQFHSSACCVVKDRRTLVITESAETPAIKMELPAEGATATPYGTLEITRAAYNGTISKERNTATIDSMKLKLPLTLRNTREGDRFAPFGMRGTKLVSDYMTDRKKSIIEKQRQLAVTDATGEIVWLVGERPATPFCVDKNTTEVTTLVFFSL